MKLTTRNISIAGSLTVLVGIVAYAVQNSIRNAAIIKKVNAILDGTGNYGDIRDFAKYFNPDFVQQIKAANPGKNLVLLADNRITEARKKIKDAWGTLSDDEDVIYAVFRALGSGIQISQVAKSYQTNYGINLLDELNNKLSDSENQKLTEIIKTKSPFQFT